MSVEKLRKARGVLKLVRFSNDEAAAHLIAQALEDEGEPMPRTLPTWRIEQLEAENDLLATALRRALDAFAFAIVADNLTIDQRRAVRAAEDALAKTGRGNG